LSPPLGSDDPFNKLGLGAARFDLADIRPEMMALVERVLFPCPSSAASVTSG
jgi:hypothetical protein